ncbi:MAG: hypothetical protein PVG20_04615 [Thioalkalispiraceae bacterium]
MFRVLCIFLMFFMVSVVSASNFNFLHESAPIADFNKDDIKMFNEAIQQALNEKKDGEKLAWKNEKTDNSGLVNPLSTYITDKSECRTVRIVNKSKKNIAESKYKFCKQDDKWVAVEIIK